MRTKTFRSVALGAGLLLGGFLFFLGGQAHAAPLSGLNADLDGMLLATGTVTSVQTTTANDATANDTWLATSTTPGVPSIAYFGMNYVFKQLTFNIGTAGTGSGAVTWEYCSAQSATCTTWTALSGVTDNTNSFQTAGTNSVTYTVPGDWVTSTIFDGEGRYYVRARETADYIIYPIATQISAIEFNLKFRVADELGTGLTGLLDGAFAVSACTDTTKFGFREIGTGLYELALLTQGADVNCNYTATSSGYVRSTAAATGNLSTASVTGTAASLPFAYKINSIAVESASTTLATVTVSAGDNSGISCTESGSAWYCPVPVSHTNLKIQTVKDGYVTASSSLFTADRTAETDAQITGTVTGVPFAYKINSIAAESVSTTLSSVTVSAGDNSGIACTESNSAWYCAVPVSHTQLKIQTVKDGYATASSSLFVADRTTNQAAQITGTVTGVPFAYKINSVAAESVSTTLSSVTVSVGNNSGVSCTESNSAWYCAVPVAQTELKIQTVKDGYVTASSSLFTADRTVNADAQITGTVTGVPFAYKINSVAGESVSTTLSSVTVSAGDNSGISCTESNSAWYCAVPVSHTELKIQTVKDGYVTASSSLFVADRTTDQAAQITGTVTGVPYAVKATITTDGSVALSSATVVAGDSLGVTCTESGSTGVYYCAVPVAHTGVTVQATKTGYSGTGTYADRTENVDAQSTVSVIAGATGGGGSSVILGASGSVSPSTVVAGGQVTYSVQITNSGNSAAQNVAVQETLPTGFSFTDGGGQSKTVSTVAQFAVGEMRTVSYGVQVGSGVAAGTYTNNVVVSNGSNSSLLYPNTSLIVTQPSSGGGGGGGGGGGSAPAPSPTPTPTPTTTPTPTASPMPQPYGQNAAVTLYRVEGDPRVYAVINNIRRHIPNPAAFSANGFAWGAIRVFSAGEASQYKEASLLRAAGDQKVYAVHGNTKTWIKTAGEFAKGGYKWEDVVEVPGVELAAYATAGAATGAAQGGTAMLKQGFTSLNVRATPSLTGKRVGRIASGQTVTILATEGVWFKIRLTSGLEGWAHSAYLQAK